MSLITYELFSDNHVKMIKIFNLSDTKIQCVHIILNVYTLKDHPYHIVH